jgi:ketosteroid isomerase-like protein
MEALNDLFRFPDSSGTLSPLRARAIKHRVSLYADDLVVFVAPVHQDIHLVRAILEAFVGASGLHTNIHKCQITPIRCSADQIELVQNIFPCHLACFPYQV